MEWDQASYSLLRFNFHYNNLGKELSLLKEFLQENNVAINSAVDVGCGDGRVTGKLREILGLDSIHGIDLNQSLLRKARKKGIITINADMNTVSLDKQFDLVISYGSLHHSRSTADLVASLRKLCRRYLLIVDNTVRSNFFHKLTGSKFFPLEASPYPIRKKGEIIQALKKCGFRVVATKTNPNANIWHDRSFFLATILDRARL